MFMDNKYTIPASLLAFHKWKFWFSGAEYQTKNKNNKNKKKKNKE